MPAHIFSSEIVELSKGRAALFSFHVGLHSRPANTGDEDGPSLVRRACSGVPDSLFYEELGRAYRTALGKQDRFRTLGFDTDYIQYRSGFSATIMQKEGWNDREIAAACYCAYFRAWRQNPLSAATFLGAPYRNRFAKADQAMFGEVGAVGYELRVTSYKLRAAGRDLLSGVDLWGWTGISFLRP